MFQGLWRRLRDHRSGPSGASRAAASRRPPFRPQLDGLETRLVPALLPVGPATGAAVGAPAGSSPKPPAPAAPAQQIDVAVGVNAPDEVVDLAGYIANWEGVRHGDTPGLSIVRNTNRDLVSASLSGTDLTLKFAPGKSGSATVTVGVKDASGASMQIAVVITVKNPSFSMSVRLPSRPLPSLAGLATGLSLPAR